eukprot:tig00021108_g18301.t1
MEAAVCLAASCNSGAPGIGLGLDTCDPFLAHSPAQRLAGEAATFLPAGCAAPAGLDGTDGQEIPALASPMLSPSAFFLDLQLDAGEVAAAAHSEDPRAPATDIPPFEFPFALNFPLHPAAGGRGEEGRASRGPFEAPSDLSGPFSPLAAPSPVPSTPEAEAAGGCPPAAPPGYVLVRVPLSQLRGQLGDLTIDLGRADGSAPVFPVPLAIGAVAPAESCGSCGPAAPAPAAAAVFGPLSGPRIPRSDSTSSLPGRLFDAATLNSPRAGPRSGASTPGRQPCNKRNLADAEADAPSLPAKRRESYDGRRGAGASAASIALSGSVNAAYLERLQREGCDGKFLPPWLCKPRPASAPPAAAAAADTNDGPPAMEPQGPRRGRVPGPAPAPALAVDAGAACNFVTYYGEGGALHTVALPDCFGPAQPQLPSPLAIDVVEAAGRGAYGGGLSLELPPAFACPAPARARASAPAPAGVASPRGFPAPPLPFESDEPLLRKVAAEQRARLRARLEAERAAASAAAARLQNPSPAEVRPVLGPSLLGTPSAPVDAYPSQGGQAAIARLAAAHPRDSIVALFDLPMADAAKRLGIAPAVVKQVCRAHGITRWPQRKLRSLARWAEQAEIVLANRVPGFDHAAISAAAARLRAARSLLYRDPAASIKDVTAAIRRLLVGPIQSRLSAAAAAAAPASGPFQELEGAAGEDSGGEGPEGPEGAGGAGVPVQVEDVNVFLHCYLAASAEARLRAKAAPSRPRRPGPGPAPAPPAAPPPAPLELPTVDISLPEGGHCLSPLLVDGALFPGL